MIWLISVTIFILTFSRARCEDVEEAEPAVYTGTTEMSISTTTPFFGEDDLSNDPKLIDGGWEFLAPYNDDGNLTAVLEQLLGYVREKKTPSIEEEKDYYKQLKNSILSEEQKLKLKTALSELSPITPTLEKPWNATDWDRFQVRLEVFYWTFMAAENETLSYLASQDYPGHPGSRSNTSNELERRLELQDKQSELQYRKAVKYSCKPKKNKSVKTSCKAFCSTSIYAEPGTIVRVSFENGFENYKVYRLSLRIGHFTADISSLPVWTQYPNMIMQKDFVVQKSGKHEFLLHSVFGGIIYIGQIKHDPIVPAIKIEVTGSVKENPSFFYNKMSPQEWKKIKLMADVPFGELISDQVTLTYPTSVIQTISNPEELLLGFENLIDGINELCGLQYKESQIHVAFSRNLPVGAPVSYPGSPILLKVSGAVELSRIEHLRARSETMTGLLHAISHNFADHFEFLKFSRKGNEALHNEIIVNYVRNVVHQQEMSAVRFEYDCKEIKNAISSYVKDEVSLEGFKKSGMALFWYYDLQRNFGWDSFKKLAKIFKGKSFSNETEQIDAVFLELSKLLNKKVDDYFTSWGLPVSNIAVTKLMSFPNSGLSISNLLDMCDNPQVNDGNMENVTSLNETECNPRKNNTCPGFPHIMPQVEEDKQPNNTVLWIPNGKGLTYEQITQNVSLIPWTDKLQGCLQIAILDAKPVPILLSRRQGIESDRRVVSPCVVASTSKNNKKGRGVFLGNSYMLDAETPELEQFMINAFMWAGDLSYRKKKFSVVFVHTGRGWGLSQTIRSTKYKLKVVNMKDFSEEDLDGAVLLVVRGFEHLNSTQLVVFDKFIKRNGGVVVALEDWLLERSWKRHPFPGKENIRAFGVAFVTDEDWGYADPDGYRISKDVPTPITPTESSKAVIEYMKRNDTDDAELTDELRTALHNLLLSSVHGNEFSKSWGKDNKEYFFSFAPITPKLKGKNVNKVWPFLSACPPPEVKRDVNLTNAIFGLKDEQ